MVDERSNNDLPGAAGESGTATEHAELDLYRLLVLSVKDYAIFALDPTGRVVTWNEGARRVNGYEAPEIIGRHFSAFYPPEDVAWDKPGYELTVARQVGRFEDEGWRVRKDGSLFWANVVITTLYDDAKQVVGFAKVTRDLTERRQAEEQRIQHARELASEEAARRAAEVHAGELAKLNAALGDHATRLRLQAGELERQNTEAGRVKQELERTNVQLRVSTAEAEAARRSAESANEAKSTFLAVMSHELRTPINAIIGYTELIADEVVGPLNDTQRVQLERVRASATHLLSLIENVLTLSRVEAGKETVYLEPVDANSLVRDSAALIAPMATAKGLRFIVDTPETPCRMMTDPTRTRQVLVNLLSNAVKFTDEGEVAISVQCPGDQVEFRVRDTGVGIPPGLCSRVFEAFWQATQSHARRRPGAGLGLSVAKHLVTLLGGEIGVESTVDVGSTFTVTLPRGNGDSAV